MSKQQLSKKLSFYKFVGCLNATYLNFLEFQQQQQKAQKHTFPRGFLKYLMGPYKHEVAAP